MMILATGLAGSMPPVTGQGPHHLDGHHVRKRFGRGRRGLAFDRSRNRSCGGRVRRRRDCGTEDDGGGLGDRLGPGLDAGAATEQERLLRNDINPDFVRPQCDERDAFMACRGAAGFQAPGIPVGEQTQSRQLEARRRGGLPIELDHLLLDCGDKHFDFPTGRGRNRREIFLAPDPFLAGFSDGRRIGDLAADPKINDGFLGIERQVPGHLQMDHRRQFAHVRDLGQGKGPQHHRSPRDGHDDRAGTEPEFVQRPANRPAQFQRVRAVGRGGEFEPLGDNPRDDAAGAPRRRVDGAQHRAIYIQRGDRTPAAHSEALSELLPPQALQDHRLIS